MLLGLLFRKHIKKLDDLSLVELIIKDDNAAHGEIFNRYSHLVMGLCLKYLKDTMTAEDMTMLIFESLPTKLKKGKVSNFKSWLYSVARNECLMKLRKKNPEQGDIEKSILYRDDDSESTLSIVKVREEKLSKLEAAINELKDEQKTCIQLFYIEQKSYDEVAKSTGFDLNKVKSYIQNGKRNLKIILEKDSEFRA